MFLTASELEVPIRIVQDLQAPAAGWLSGASVHNITEYGLCRHCGRLLPADVTTVMSAQVSPGLLSTLQATPQMLPAVLAECWWR